MAPKSVPKVARENWAPEMTTILRKKCSDTYSQKSPINNNWCPISSKSDTKKSSRKDTISLGAMYGVYKVGCIDKKSVYLKYGPLWVFNMGCSKLLSAPIGTVPESPPFLSYNLYGNIFYGNTVLERTPFLRIE